MPFGASRESKALGMMQTYGIGAQAAMEIGGLDLTKKGAEAKIKDIIEKSKPKEEQAFDAMIKFGNWKPIDQTVDAIKEQLGQLLMATGALNLILNVLQEILKIIQQFTGSGARDDVKSWGARKGLTAKEIAAVSAITAPEGEEGGVLQQAAAGLNILRAGGPGHVNELVADFQKSAEHQHEVDARVKAEQDALVKKVGPLPKIELAKGGDEMEYPGITSKTVKKGKKTIKVTIQEEGDPSSGATATQRKRAQVPQPGVGGTGP
jgi:hypothetical protein